MVDVGAIVGHGVPGGFLVLFAFVGKKRFRQIALFPILIGSIIEAVGGFIFYGDFLHQAHHLGLYICFLMFVMYPKLLCVSLMAETLLFLDHSMDQPGIKFPVHLLLTFFILLSAVSEFYSHHWKYIFLGLQGALMIILPICIQVLDSEYVITVLIVYCTWVFAFFHRYLDKPCVIVDAQVVDDLEYYNPTEGVIEFSELEQ